MSKPHHPISCDVVCVLVDVIGVVVLTNAVMAVAVVVVDFVAVCRGYMWQM